MKLYSVTQVRPETEISGIHYALEFFFNRSSQVAEAGLELLTSLLPSTKGWDYSHAPPGLAYSVLASYILCKHPTNPALRNLRFLWVMVCSVILHLANFFTTPTFRSALWGCDPQLKKLGPRSSCRMKSLILVLRMQLIFTPEW